MHSEGQELPPPSAVAYWVMFPNVNFGEYILTIDFCLFLWISQIKCYCHRIKFTTPTILTRCVSGSFYRHYQIPSIHSCSHLWKHMYLINTTLGLRTHITLWLWALIWPMSRSWAVKEQIIFVAVSLFFDGQCLHISFALLSVTWVICLGFPSVCKILLLPF